MVDFVKKEWQFRDIISENELNRMEDGIEEGITKAEKAQGDLTDHQSASVLDHPDGSVTTAKLADGAVTAVKVAADVAKTAELNAHINATTDVHGATSAATANRIVQRDSSGRAKFAAPAASDDVARKAETDAALAAAQAAQATANSHASRHASGGDDPITPEMIGAWYAGNLPVESGNWTVTLSGQTTPGTPTYITRMGRYYRVGRLINIYFVCIISNKGGMSGRLVLGGLPFLAATGSGGLQGITINTMKVTYPTDAREIYGGLSAAAPNIIFTFRVSDGSEIVVDTSHIDDSFEIRGSGTYLID